MKNRLLTTVGLGALLAQPLHAQLGPLDMTFGVNGVFANDLGGGTAMGHAVALQPDGKIVMAGSGNQVGPWFDWVVIRLTIDGALDPTFSGDGIVTSGWNTSNEQAHRVAVQADGKILIAGWHYNGAINAPMVMRLLSDGSLDPDFGAGGAVLFSTFMTDGIFEDMDLMPDGTIAVSCSLNGNSRIDLLNADGTSDLTYGSGGYVLVPSTPGLGSEPFIAPHPSGGLILLNTLSNPLGDYYAKVTRILVDGVVDTTFGTNGSTVVDVVTGPNGDLFRDVLVDPTGRLILFGHQMNAGPDPFVLARLDANGLLDASFGTNGLLITNPGVPEIAKAMDLLRTSDGQLMMTGLKREFLGEGTKTIIMRCSEDGVLDPGFGFNGVLWFPDSQTLRGKSLVQQSDGLVIVAGYKELPYGFFCSRLAGDLVTSVGPEPDPTDGITQLEVFPNPATNACMVRYPQASRGSANIHLLDAWGRICHQWSFSTNTTGGQEQQLALPPLATGAYMLCIATPGQRHRIPVVIE